MRRIPRLTLLSLFALACGPDDLPQEPEPVPEEIEPGRFAFAQLQGLEAATVLDTRDSFRGNLARTAALVQPALLSQSNFDLGTLKATDRFFFILSNAGGASITGVTIASSNPAFEVSPTSINELPPDTGATFFPIVRVTAVHGTSPSGIGFEGVMAAGSNSTTLDFNGTTQDSIPVQLNATLTVNVLLMDIRAFVATGELDLSAPAFLANPDARTGGVGVPGFTVQSDVTIQNTGNVDITTSVFDRDFSSSSLGVLPRDSSLVIPGLGVGDVAFLWLDGGGAASDQTRLPIVPNGNVILFFGRN